MHSKGVFALVRPHCRDRNPKLELSSTLGVPGIDACADNVLGVMAFGKKTYAKPVSEGEIKHGFIEPVAVSVEDGSLLASAGSVLSAWDSYRRYRRLVGSSRQLADMIMRRQRLDAFLHGCVVPMDGSALEEWLSAFELSPSQWWDSASRVPVIPLKDLVATLFRLKSAPLPRLTWLVKVTHLYHDAKRSVVRVARPRTGHAVPRFYAFTFDSEAQNALRDRTAEWTRVLCSELMQCMTALEEAYQKLVDGQAAPAGVGTPVATAAGTSTTAFIPLLQRTGSSQTDVAPPVLPPQESIASLLVGETPDGASKQPLGLAAAATEAKRAWKASKRQREDDLTDEVLGMGFSTSFTAKSVPRPRPNPTNKQGTMSTPVTPRVGVPAGSRSPRSTPIHPPINDIDVLTSLTTPSTHPAPALRLFDATVLSSDGSARQGFVRIRRPSCDLGAPKARLRNLQADFVSKAKLWTFMCRLVAWQCKSNLVCVGPAVETLLACVNAPKIVLEDDVIPLSVSRLQCCVLALRVACAFQPVITASPRLSGACFARCSAVFQWILASGATVVDPSPSNTTPVETGNSQTAPPHDPEWELYSTPCLEEATAACVSLMSAVLQSFPQCAQSTLLSWSPLVLVSFAGLCTPTARSHLRHALVWTGRQWRFSSGVLDCRDQLLLPRPEGLHLRLLGFRESGSAAPTWCCVAEGDVDVCSRILDLASDSLTQEEGKAVMGALAFHSAWLTRVKLWSSFLDTGSCGCQNSPAHTCSLFQPVVPDNISDEVWTQLAVAACDAKFPLSRVATFLNLARLGLRAPDRIATIVTDLQAFKGFHGCSNRRQHLLQRLQEPTSPAVAVCCPHCDSDVTQLTLATLFHSKNRPQYDFAEVTHSCGNLSEVATWLQSSVSAHAPLGSWQTLDMFLSRCADASVDDVISLCRVGVSVLASGFGSTQPHAHQAWLKVLTRAVNAVSLKLTLQVLSLDQLHALCCCFAALLAKLPPSADDAALLSDLILSTFQVIQSPACFVALRLHAVCCVRAQVTCACHSVLSCPLGVDSCPLMSMLRLVCACERSVSPSFGVPGFVGVTLSPALRSSLLGCLPAEAVTDAKLPSFDAQFSVLPQRVCIDTRFLSSVSDGASYRGAVQELVKASGCVCDTCSPVTTSQCSLFVDPWKFLENMSDSLPVVQLLAFSRPADR